MTTIINKSMFLATDAETVWAHLTQPDLLGKWFHPSQAPLAEGEDFTLTSQKDGDRMCWGKVTKMNPHTDMTWDFTVGPMNGAMSTVHWRIEDAPGGVRLSLEHSGLPEAPEAFGLVLALDKGWHGFVLALRDLTDA